MKPIPLLGQVLDPQPDATAADAIAIAVALATPHTPETLALFIRENRLGRHFQTPATAAPTTAE
jgi:hypothetical protein